MRLLIQKPSTRLCLPDLAALLASGWLAIVNYLLASIQGWALRSHRQTWPGLLPASGLHALLHDVIKTMVSVHLTQERACTAAVVTAQSDSTA
jgi:hypothetical protein